MNGPTIMAADAYKFLYSAKSQGAQMKGRHLFGCFPCWPRHRHLSFLFGGLLTVAILWIFLPRLLMPDAIDRLHSSPRPTKNLNLFANAKNSQKAKSAPSVEPFDFEADLDCGRVFAPDEAYTTGIIEKKGRWTMEDEEQMLHGKMMDCGEIKARNGFKEMQEWRSQQKVREMPLAFARIVHKDYLFLEKELFTHWSPQNWYCYTLDAKSAPAFRAQMNSLAKCLPNVLIAKREFNITSSGVSISDAFMECAAELAAKPERKWEYLVTLQNHDVQAKTNAEMGRIFGWLGGANDIEFAKMNNFTRIRLKYYRDKFKWTFKALKLFKKGSRNRQRDPENGERLELRLAKGYSTASLSRPFVDFILGELNLTRLLSQLNRGYFGMDEHLWQSLSTTDALDAPGGYPQRCFEGDKDYEPTRHKTKDGRMNYISRYALWFWGSHPNCRSGFLRHSVCVFGLEDLGIGHLEGIPHLFINKMMPQYDYGAIHCWHQRMRNRTLEGAIQLDEEHYQNWPQTRFQELRKKLPLDKSSSRRRGHNWGKYFNCQTGEFEEG